MTDRILATYRIAASESESRVRADALAAEQSVEMPVAVIGDPRVLEEIVARVESIKPHAGEFDVVLVTQYGERRCKVGAKDRERLFGGR